MQDPFPNAEQVAEQAGKQILFLDDQTRMEASMDSLHTALHVRWQWTEPVQNIISVLFHELMMHCCIKSGRKVLLWCGLKLAKIV
jgi:hypothetical protein